MVTDEHLTGETPDARLVRRARGGDNRAMDLLVRRHHGVVYRVAFSMLGDRDVAQDVTQDTFLKAFRGLSSFRGDAAFRTWLITIAMNEARGALRRRARRRETTLENTPPVADEEPDPAERSVVADQVRRALELLKRLPEKQRLAVTLRVQEGMSFREIGDAIGSSEGAARVNYFHGIRRLREWMER